MTNPAQSRFQVYSAGAAPHPNKCAVCGTVERDLIDFGMDAEVEGAVLFCTDCFAEAAKKLDYVDNTTYLEAVNETVTVKMNLDRAVAEVKRFVNVFADSANALDTAIGITLSEPPIRDAVGAETNLSALFRGPGETGPASNGPDGQDDGDAGDKGSVSISSSSSDDLFAE